MAEDCVEAVHAATGRVFTDQEVSDLLNRVADRAIRARKATPGLSDQAAIIQAANGLTHEQLRQELSERRTKIATEVAREQLRRDSDALGAAGFSPADRLDALTVGSERQAPGSSASTDAEGRAREADLWGSVQIGLSKMPGLVDRLSNFFGVAEKGFDRKIAAEMARLNGAGNVEPTGDEAALHAARVFVAALRRARELQNGVGAWIDEIPGYIARQSHDAEKIAGGFWREISEMTAHAKETGQKLDWSGANAAAQTRAFSAWRDFLMPRLDPRTFEGLSPEMFADRDPRALAAQGEIKNPEDVRELMLHRIFLDILTGRHEELSGADDASDYRPPASRARQVSASRTLHFASPDAFMEYNDRYGRSSLYSSIINQLGRAGRNTALMRRWGPNPEAGFAAEKDRLTAEARQKPGGAAAVKALDDWKVNNRFEQVNGTANTPVNMRLSTTMRTIRQFEASTKLGGIVLSKATDMILSGSTAARSGAGFLAGYGGMFKGLLRLGNEEERHAADLMHVGARAFANRLTSQFVTTDGPLGWSASAVQLTYKVGGFEYANDAAQHGAAQVQARHFGVESAKRWDGLETGTRETLERYGVSPEEWEAARKSQVTAPDGLTYWGMDKVEPNLAWKFSAMFHELIANATGEARARERSATTFGTKPGTAVGEAVRMLAQLKGFLTSVYGRHLVPAASGFAGYSPVACLAQLIVGGTLAGYLSMNAKMIASGQAPRPVVGADASETAKTWSAALVQGGGLGLIGDWLFGEQGRSGARFSFGQLGGPFVADAEQVVQVLQQAMSGGDFSETTGRTPIPGELVRLASRNIPVVQTWYSRLALEYLVLWRIQEAVSPGYLARYEQRVQTQEKRQWLLPPTSAQ